MAACTSLQNRAAAVGLESVAVDAAAEEGADLSCRPGEGFIITLFLIQEVGQQQGDAILLQLQGMDEGSHRVAGLSFCLDEAFELFPVQTPGQSRPHCPNGSIHCLQVVLYESGLSQDAFCCEQSSKHLLWRVQKIEEGFIILHSQ